MNSRQALGTSTLKINNTILEMKLGSGVSKFVLQNNLSYS